MLNPPGPKVFGWFADYDGCGYYRLTKPLETLYASLAQGQVWTTASDRILPADWPDYDVIVGQRICKAGDDFAPANLWANRVTKDQQILSVFEIDDDLFSLPEESPGYAFFSQPEVQNNLKACAFRSDLVTVSTEHLRAQMMKYNPNVKVLPNYVDKEVLAFPRPPERSITVIGWAGSSTHEEDFETAIQELGIVMALNQSARFMTIGGNYTQGLPQNRVRALPWMSGPRRVYKYIAGFDIGIAPLSKNKFNMSKSWIKALEYAALGIPCVATNFGPYPDFIEHGVTGFLVSKPGEWKEYVSLLLNDQELRENMGKAARHKAQDYTIQGNVWRWADAYTA